MIRRIHIIIDCSGSMMAYGKKEILLNANRALRRCSMKREYQSFQIDFYQWNTEITIWNKGTLQIHGSADINAFMNFLEECEKNDRILLLSDGSFSLDEIEIKLKQDKILLLPIAVGADADLNSLKRMSSVRKVYTISSIIDVFERICNGFDQEVH